MGLLLRMYGVCMAACKELILREVFRAVRSMTVSSLPLIASIPCSVIRCIVASLRDRKGGGLPLWHVFLMCVVSVAMTPVSRSRMTHR